MITERASLSIRMGRSLDVFPGNKPSSLISLNMCSHFLMNSALFMSIPHSVMAAAMTGTIITAFMLTVPAFLGFTHLP